jgi:hypothetical protein
MTSTFSNSGVLCWQVAHKALYDAAVHEHVADHPAIGPVTSCLPSLAAGRLLRRPGNVRPHSAPSSCCLSPLATAAYTGIAPASDIPPSPLRHAATRPHSPDTRHRALSGRHSCHTGRHPERRTRPSGPAGLPCRLVFRLHPLAAQRIQPARCPASHAPSGFATVLMSPGQPPKSRRF